MAQRRKTMIHQHSATGGSRTKQWLLCSPLLSFCLSFFFLFFLLFLSHFSLACLRTLSFALPPSSRTPPSLSLSLSLSPLVLLILFHFCLFSLSPSIFLFPSLISLFLEPSTSSVCSASSPFRSPLYTLPSLSLSLALLFLLSLSLSSRFACSSDFSFLFCYSFRAQQSGFCLFLPSLHVTQNPAHSCLFITTSRQPSAKVVVS